jgi:hypothetical protein
MKQSYISYLVLALMSLLPMSSIQAGFGSSFAGSFVGSLAGSAIGNAVTSPRRHYHDDTCECRRCLRRARIERARAQEARALAQAEAARAERRRLERARRARPVITYVYEDDYYAPHNVYVVHEHRGNPGAAIGCGLIGFGLGTALGSALN